MIGDPIPRRRTLVRRLRAATDPPAPRAVVGGVERRATFSPVPVEVTGDVELQPLGGDTRSLREWTTNFHLVLVVLDPFTFESAWILEQAGKLLRHFGEADCRVAWMVTGSEGNARQFLGPWAEEALTFIDPDRAVVGALGIERLPAFVHLNVDHAIEGRAEGWRVAEWQAVADTLARQMSWTTPELATFGGPGPYEGSPASG
jgi:hypothetical protein